MWARNCQESLFGFFCCVLAKFWKRRQFLTISSSLYINWNCQELLTFWKCSHFLAIPCLHIVTWELPGTCCIFGNSQEPLSFLTPVSGDSQPIIKVFDSIIFRGTNQSFVMKFCMHLRKLKIDKNLLIKGSSTKSKVVVFWKLWVLMKIMFKVRYDVYN